MSRVGSMLSLVVLVMAAPMLPPAQAQVRWFAVGGPANVSASFGPFPTMAHVAAGAELQIVGPLAVAAECGFFDYLAVPAVTGVVRADSVGGSKFSPFVAGGFSSFTSGDGGFNALVIDVGTDFKPWSGPAFRVEFRNQQRLRSHLGPASYRSLRFGVVF